MPYGCQQGGSDCGLFAIAYVVDILEGLNPAKVIFTVINVF